MPFLIKWNCKIVQKALVPDFTLWNGLTKNWPEVGKLESELAWNRVKLTRIQPCVLDVRPRFMRLYVAWVKTRGLIGLHSTFQALHIMPYSGLSPGGFWDWRLRHFSSRILLFYNVVCGCSQAQLMLNFEENFKLKILRGRGYSPSAPWLRRHRRVNFTLNTWPILTYTTSIVFDDRCSQYSRK